MAQSVERSASIHTKRTHETSTIAVQEDDYDIPSDLDDDLGDRPMYLRDSQLAKKLEKMKKANKKLLRPDTPPVIIENFDDLFFERGMIDEIRASKGKVEVRKLLYDEESVGHILSFVFAKLIQGAPGDSGPKALKNNADKFAIDLAPKIAQIRQNPEFKTYRQVATELTRLNVATDRGEEKNAEWQPTSVRNIEMRIEKLKKAGKLKLA